MRSKRRTAPDDAVEVERALAVLDRVARGGSIDGNRLRNRSGQDVAAALALNGAGVLAVLTARGAPRWVLAPALGVALVLSLRVVAIARPVRTTDSGLFLGGRRDRFVAWDAIDGVVIRRGTPCVRLVTGKHRNLPALRAPIPFVADSVSRSLVGILSEEHNRQRAADRLSRPRRPPAPGALPSKDADDTNDAKDATT